jgi:glycosyltransferase involved in cell wall biosynthesis
MVTREYPPFIVGGVGTHTFQLVKYLRKIGVDVTVISFGNPKLTTEDEIFLSPLSSLLEEARTTTPLHKDLLLVKDIKRIMSYTRELLKEKKHDIVHVQEPYIGGLITYDKKVTTMHDTGIGEVKSILKYSNLSNLQVLKKSVFYLTLGYFMEYVSIFTSKTVIVPSYACKQELVNMYKIYPSKVVVIHNGIEVPPDIPSKEEARKILGLPKDKIIVLTVGRHIPQKRIDLLVEATYRLDKNVRDNMLVIIIGQGPETPLLIHLVEKYRLNDTIKFLGFVPHENVWLYYSASDMFILTSDKESAPMALLEAASIGNAIITSRTGDYSLLMKNRIDGMVFESGDLNMLAKILEELIVDENLRYTLSRNAKLFASRFTADKMALKTFRVYQKLIGESLR